MHITPQKLDSLAPIGRHMQRAISELTSDTLRPGVDLSSPALVSLTMAASGWQTPEFRAHVHEMEKYRSRMLEVSVKSDRPPRWEWQVTSNGEMIANGFEDGQIEARFEGYNAMFLLLAAGWAP